MYLRQFRDYLAENGDSLCLRDLAYTLHSRRSVLQVTAAFSASSVSDLSERISDLGRSYKSQKTTPIKLLEPGFSSSHRRRLGCRVYWAYLPEWEQNYCPHHSTPP